MGSDFERDVLAWCRRERILPPGAAVLVAVSGGPDSTALLHCLHALAPREGWRLAVAHLDHGLRPASADDASFVRRQATSRGLPFFTARVDVPSLPSSVRRSLEESARLARRSFLARTAVDFGAEAVALGHTLDDQAETVLINLTRGAGTLGLAAMPPAAGFFVRPFLERSRAEIVDYLARRGLAWREDPTNRDPTLVRNWFRAEVLPVMESRLPGARAALASLAAAARADEEALERRTAALLGRLLVEAEAERVALAAPFPAALPEALRGRAVRALYRHLTGSRRGLERRHVEAVLALPESGAVCLPGDVVVRRTARGTTFRRRKVEPALRRWEAALRVPGRTYVRPVGVELVASPARAPAVLRGRGREEVWLDARFASADLWVRSWRKGDTLRPIGLGGRKKLQDLFVDAKIPAGNRRRWPVVGEGSNILWVPALALAEGVGAEAGRRALHVRCLRPRGPLRLATPERRRHGLQG